MTRDVFNCEVLHRSVSTLMTVVTFSMLPQRHLTARCSKCGMLVIRMYKTTTTTAVGPGLSLLVKSLLHTDRDKGNGIEIGKMYGMDENECRKTIGRYGNTTALPIFFLY